MGRLTEKNPGTEKKGRRADYDTSDYNYGGSMGREKGESEEDR